MFVLVQETYPQTPPIWFSESEDFTISVIIEKLSDTSKRNYNVRGRHFFVIFSMISCCQCCCY